MQPRNLFPLKFATDTLLKDIVERTQIFLRDPGLKGVAVVVDPELFDRLGGQMTLDHRCVFMTPAEVTDDFLAKCDPARVRFLYAVECNSDGLPVIERLIRRGFRYLPAGGAPVGSYAYENRVAMETIEAQYLSQTVAGYGKFDDPGTREDFANLCQMLELTRDIAGDVVEVGCYKGSSSSIILQYAKSAGLDKKCYFYDTFDGFSYEEARRSADGLWQNTHATDGIGAVRQRLLSIGYPQVSVERLNIIHDSLPPTIQSIAMANLDVDLYEAVDAGLRKIAPLVPAGGVIICEDAGHTPNLIGARYALQQFLRTQAGKRFSPVFMTSGQVLLLAR